MRLTEFIIVVVASLIFLLPTMKKQNEGIGLNNEAQEEMQMQEEEVINTFKVTFEAKNLSEEATADIIWMKKAAVTARDAGIPYFNVLKQKISKRYVPRFKTHLSVVEGVIQLDNDPMRAEYDANEIEALILTEQ